MAHDQAADIVASAVADVGHIDVPEVLKDRIARQNAHLVELAANLIASGMNEPRIKDVVREAMGSYEEELVETILALKAEADSV
ncbi:hypothetical protein CKO28_25080 [Rhodovibrio sodomensis]|uniref:Uncharacterized protein n=1 Tax=Rhodovibrio sodomensis TaxID=1088 RepID=A0ABS1DMC6_9PROT|nr:hypothetical protein [Rhodovibrio sodomensis]MBK1671278.1 hypothetical protein [Rhodovibrio sodomensis]